LLPSKSITDFILAWYELLTQDLTGGYYYHIGQFQRFLGGRLRLPHGQTLAPSLAVAIRTALSPYESSVNVRLEDFRRTFELIESLCSTDHPIDNPTLKWSEPMVLVDFATVAIPAASEDLMSVVDPVRSELQRQAAFARLSREAQDTGDFQKGIRVTSARLKKNVRDLNALPMNDPTQTRRR
jgi:hypothetical protein